MTNVKQPTSARPKLPAESYSNTTGSLNKATDTNPSAAYPDSPGPEQTDRGRGNNRGARGGRSGRGRGAYGGSARNQRNFSPIQNRRGRGRGYGTSNQLSSPERSSPPRPQVRSSAIRSTANTAPIRVLRENDNPVNVLWRAIHLDQSKSMTDIEGITKYEVLKHERLKGAILAAAGGRTRIDVIQAAARLGVDLSSIKETESGWSIMHAAATSNSLPMVEAVIGSSHSDQLKTSINDYACLLGTTKWTPLLFAVKNGFHEAVIPLLNAGADPFKSVHVTTPDLVSPSTGEMINRKEGRVYPIFFAIKSCPVEVVQALFEAMQSQQPDISLETTLTDSRGRTCFHYLSERPHTAEGGAEPVLQYLLSLAPALFKIRDLHGNTPLHESCRRKQDDSTSAFITLLGTLDDIDLSIEALTKNQDDVAPLQFAIAAGNQSSARILLDHCAPLLGGPDQVEEIRRAIIAGKYFWACNTLSLQISELDKLEEGAFNAFMALTKGDVIDQTQLIRAVKRLGPMYCMQFIAEFTMSDVNAANSPTAWMRENPEKRRDKGGHFLTLLKERLIYDSRQEDWSHIRLLTDVMNKKLRGKQRKEPANEIKFAGTSGGPVPRPFPRRDNFHNSHTRPHQARVPSQSYQSSTPPK